jgi:hypothetical protein
VRWRWDRFLHQSSAGDGECGLSESSLSAAPEVGNRPWRESSDYSLDCRLCISMSCTTCRDGRERASLIFAPRITEAHRGEAWISEGNFASWTFDIRLPRAEAFIVLERPRWLCLWRVFWRAAMERRNRPDLPLGCSEQIDRDLLEYIWNFGKIGRHEIEVARLNHGPSVPALRLGRNREVSAFLSSPQFPSARASTAENGA